MPSTQQSSALRELWTDICEAGTFCDIDCAEGYANFDEAKGCANAGKGYCCKDTKPAKYPFTPNTK